MRRLPLLLFLAALGLASSEGAAVPLLPPPPPAAPGPAAVPTFACLGLSWSPPEGAADNACEVRYREAGAPQWSRALDLWFDPRNGEYRGSIVQLRAGTAYEISLRLGRTGTAASLSSRTWADEFPVARTVVVPSSAPAPYRITEGGNPAGYVLYVAASGGTVLDAANQAPACVVVEATYVIVRGLVLKNAQRDGLLLHGPVHDVVVERCDISGWGRVAPDGFGMNLDAGIRADSPDVGRIVAQRNLIHHPRSNSNDWRQPRPGTGEKNPNHPEGPQGIVLANSRGNNVLRYNEVYSDEAHRFNDGLGANDNFSFQGYPGPDSDVYGNVVRNACDDALEIEGGGRNVRVWGNYLDHTATGVSSASASIGPLYIFRNVYNVSRWASGNLGAADNHGIFGKISDTDGYGGGRRYFFHNTVLQPPATGRPGTTAGAGWGAGDSAGPMTNTVSRNNIWQIAPEADTMAIWKVAPWSVSDHGRSGANGNDFDFDLCNGRIALAPDQEAHAIRGVPAYAAGNGPDAFPDEGGRIRPSGKYALDPASPGFRGGQAVPNFNDGGAGKAVTPGAQEDGQPPLEFGVDAYSK